MHPKDKGNGTLFGDAGSATLISSDGFSEIGNFSLGTDGKGRENLIVKTAGMRNREKADDLKFDENGNPISSDHLYMNGSEIFNFTIEAVPPLIEDTLKKNDILFEEMDSFIFHQVYFTKPINSC